MTDVVWTGEWHPLAERFPMLSEDEIRQMAASIAANGQYVPCVMGPDGLGRDGRNRVAACALVGVEPRWEIHNGDPVAFIIEVNAERRHLTTGQRAMAVAIGLADAGKRRNGRFVRGSKQGDTGGASRIAWTAALAEAGVVLDHAPELADDVLGGKEALDAAYRQADERRKARERIDALGGELSALVDSGVIDVEEAERRADEAHRLEELDDDLAERVRGETLSLAEAETLMVERAERVKAWALRIREALHVLGGMAGYPVPEALATLLTDAERQGLDAVLGVIPKGGFDER